jgi:hydrogenase maturation protein HypF
MQSGNSVAELAHSFHLGFMQALVATACLAREQTARETVALSGGVFNNRFIATHLPRMLREEGFTVLTHKNLPPNDGCISYGQAMVALAQLNKSAEAGTLPLCV